MYVSIHVQVSCTFIYKFQKDDVLLILKYQIKYLFDELRYVCNELKDKNEIAIMKKYGSKSQRITIQLTSKSILLSVMNYEKKCYFVV